MLEHGAFWDKPHRKIEDMESYLRDDSSVYDALVTMARPEVFRYPLVNVCGDLDSKNGDSMSAMSYTYARLEGITRWFVYHINEDTIDFEGMGNEPSFLPVCFPNLLVNGTAGVAGMISNIPPHNLREVAAAIIKMIDNKIDSNKKTTVNEILSIVKAPDFPAGGIIVGTKGIEEAYKTGRGRIIVRAAADIETTPDGSQIVITELPYLTRKSDIIQEIAILVGLKNVDGITGIRDESDSKGMRIVIEVGNDSDARMVLDYLFDYTQLEGTFDIVMLVLVKGHPRVMNLRDMLETYIAYQGEVVKRRTAYKLKRDEERAHIEEGLLAAVDNMDEVIRIISGSDSLMLAKEGLIEKLELTEVQSQVIVDMRFRMLVQMEKKKLEEEYQDLQKRILHLKTVLTDENSLLRTIREELYEVACKYGDDRRSRIVFQP